MPLALFKLLLFVAPALLRLLGALLLLHWLLRLLLSLLPGLLRLLLALQDCLIQRLLSLCMLLTRTLAL